MKILCPIDFSNSSIHAAKWIGSYLERQGGGVLEFLHCINVRSRSSMFLKMDEILKEQAERDMVNLIETLSTEVKKVKLSSKIAVVDPKSFISQYADKNGFAWIVVGTQGLTALKDITVGSVTEYLINKSSCAVLSIPDQCELNEIKVVVMGVDGDSKDDEATIQPVIDLCLKNQASLRMIHFKSKDRDPSVEAPSFFASYPNLDWKFEQRSVDVDLPVAINAYCQSVQADVLCLVHHRRNWWQRIFTKSLSKSELFTLQVPLFIPGRK